MYLRFSFIILIISLISNCSKAKEFTEIALEYENKFQKVEASYYYSKAIEEDEDFFLANKNLGILLSKSSESLDVSLYHLEKAFNSNDKDQTLAILIYNLILVNQDFQKLKSIKNLLMKNLSLDQIEILTSLETCTLNPEEAKKMISKITSKDYSEIEFFIHHSLSYCYGLSGDIEKKSTLLEKYEQ